MKSILSLLAICISFGLSSNIQENKTVENIFNINDAIDFNNRLNKYADKYPVKFENEKEKIAFQNEADINISKLENSIKAEETMFLLGDLYRKSHNAEFTKNSHELAYSTLMTCIKEFKSSRCKFSLAKHLSQIKKDNFKSTEVLLRSIDMSSINNIELKKDIYNYKVLINLSNKKFSSAYYNINSLLSIEDNVNDKLFENYFEIETQQKKEKIKKTVHKSDFLDKYNLETDYNDKLFVDLIDYSLNSNFLLDKNEGKLIGFIGSMIRVNPENSSSLIKKHYYNSDFKQDKLLFIKSIYFSGIEFDINTLIQHEPFLIKNYIKKNKEKWIKNGVINNIKLDSIQKYDILIATYYVSKDKNIITRMLTELHKNKTNKKNDINKSLCINSIEWFISNNLEDNNIKKTILSIEDENLLKVIEEIKEKIE